MSIESDVPPTHHLASETTDESFQPVACIAW